MALKFSAWVSHTPEPTLYNRYSLYMYILIQNIITDSALIVPKCFILCHSYVSFSTKTIYIHLKIL